MQKRTSKALKSKNTGEDAVSPVVGVMLLLVVTVIIAAVVATFASGLVTTQQTVPTLAADVKIVAMSGTSASSGVFEMTVVAVSEDIPTKDLKLVTKYTTKDKDGNSISGGAVVYGKVNNTKYSSVWKGETKNYEYVSQLGFGSGVQGTAVTSGQYGENQWFGNYALTEGTYMQNNGALSTVKNGETDGLDAILGKEWRNLKSGDTVDVTIIHVPTNGVIYTNTVTVE